MAGHGGARNRSGPHASMFSARSDARDVRALRLPVGGYHGEIPELDGLLDATDRERAVWAEAWRTPQAAQWVRESWRHRTIAMWVRWSVRAEARDATAATITAAQRLADQIGMTPAGLKENGWLIVADDSATDEVQQGRQRKAETAAAQRASGRTGRARRLRAVD